MPYESQAQAAFFNTHRKQLARQGVNVDEWNQASKGLKLPEHSSQRGLTQSKTKRGTIARSFNL